MAVGNRGQGVWRGEVFVWQRHRQWGGEAGEMRSGQGVWRGRGADVIKKECLAGAPSFDNQKTIGEVGNFLFFYSWMLSLFAILPFWIS